MSDPTSDAPSKNAPTESAPDERPRETLGEIIRTVFYALLIAFAFRTVLYQPFSIPSGSMKPTLLIGDYLFVSKYAYGYSKYSLPWGHMLPDSVFGGRLFGADPARGDVAVFRNPNDENQDYIKRVVGLPGDRVRVTNGVLYINEEPVTLRRVEAFIEPRSFGRGGLQNCIRPDSFDRFRVSPADRARFAEDPGGLCLKAAFTETLPNGVSHAVLDSNGPTHRLDNTRTFRVPEGSYFFMGDNRDNSADSRAEIGFVPAQNLIGRAEIILFSAEGSFWQLWTWRGDRFFNAID